MNNPYWEGHRLLIIKREDIDPKCMDIGKLQYQSVIFINRTFKFWFNSRKLIKAAQPFSLQYSMTKSLEDTGTDGYGHGVNDLKEVFEHLWLNRNNKPKWKDSNWRYYCPYKNNKKFSVNGRTVYGPDGVINFSKSIDAKTKILEEALQKFQYQTLKVKKKNDDWTNLMSIAKNINDLSKKTHYLFWMMSSSNDAIKVLNKINKGSSHLLKLDQTLKWYYANLKCNVSTRESHMLLLTKNILAIIPIFGEIYSKSIDMGISLVRNFTDTIKARIAKIDNILRHH